MTGCRLLHRNSAKRSACTKMCRGVFTARVLRSTSAADLDILPMFRSPTGNERYSGDSRVAEPECEACMVGNSLAVSAARFNRFYLGGANPCHPALAAHVKWCAGSDATQFGARRGNCHSIYGGVGKPPWQPHSQYLFHS